MTLPKKLLLSVPSFIFILFFWLFFAVPTNDFMLFYHESFLFQQFIILLLNGAIIGQIAYLIVKIWSLKNIQTDIKMKWMMLIIIFGIVTALIFIWYKYPQLLQKNEQRAKILSKPDC